MPFSYAQYTGNGSTTTFSVPFPYLLKAHVKLYTGFNILDGTFTSQLVDGTDYTYTSGTQVQTTVAPATGVVLTVLRDTPDGTLLVPWQDGSNLIADDLNTSDLQNLYVVQEQQDRNDAGASASLAATAAANTATTAANAATATAASATATANTALSQSASAQSTSTTALSNSATALSQSTTALSDSAAAVSDSATALSQSNTAIADSATALSQSTTALADSATALSQSNDALSDSATAFSQSATALSAANSAVSTANTAASDASTALSTANTAASNASTAVSTANSAVSTANSAAAAVAAAVLYQPVIDLAALALLTPTDGEFFELQDSTGADTDPSITGVPVGLVGSAGLTFRLRHDDPPGEYVFLGYFANDSETRYAVKATEQAASDAQADATQALSDAAAAQADASQGIADAAAAQNDAIQALADAAAAQSTANAALPKAGGTLTGDVTLNAQSGLRFADADSSNWVAFQGPATVSSNVTWTLPAADGTTGQVLSTNGSATLSWATAAGGGASVTTSDTAPSTPADGDLWYDSVGGRLYVYYEDPNTSQWVDAAPQGGGDAGFSKLEVGNTKAEVTDTGSNGTFAVTTEGTERFRVTSAGLVGIGTAGPAKPLHVFGSGTQTFWLESSDSQKAIGAINVDNNSYAFQSTYNVGGTAARPFAWYNVSTELMRLETSGRLLVGVNTANANGGVLQLSSGITFPANEIAASNANTLDDYEEGTWTPAYSSGSNVWSYTTQIGRYVKVGNLVTYTFAIVAQLTSNASLNSQVAIVVPFGDTGGPESGRTYGSCRFGGTYETHIIQGVFGAITWARSDSAGDGNGFANTTNWPAATTRSHRGTFVTILS